MRELKLPTCYTRDLSNGALKHFSMPIRPVSEADQKDTKATASVEQPLKGKDEILSALEVAEKNRSHVIHCVLFIEEAICRIVARYFFPESGDRRDEFTNIVLNSDWCSYASKRKLFSHVIESARIVQGADKQRLQESLRKAGAWRNAFAHGRIYEQDGFIYLSYFEGTPRVQRMDELFFRKIEDMMEETFFEIDVLSMEPGENWAR